ncbi:MAG: hypothetical protein M3340_07335, partial [Actinomycetota bacterium]|nr:hypothetical protein [Actinomycetota bacterium]
MLLGFAVLSHLRQYADTAEGVAGAVGVSVPDAQNEFTLLEQEGLINGNPMKAAVVPLGLDLYAEARAIIGRLRHP